MGYQTVKSVEKAMALLDFITERTFENRASTLAEISSAVKIPPATARSLLRTLELTGHVARVGHGLYEEGPKCSKLFRNEGVFRQLKRVSAPIVERTANELGESVLLASLAKGRRIELLRCQADDDRLVDPQWSANEKFYAMHTTRAVLAWFSQAQLAAFVDANGLPSLEDWPACGGRLEGLKAELSRIRMAGGSFAMQGNYVAAAVPVLTGGGDVVASLGCYAPLSRTDKPRAAGIFRMLHDCAQEIQRELGEAPFQR